MNLLCISLYVHTVLCVLPFFSSIISCLWQVNSRLLCSGASFMQKVVTLEREISNQSACTIWPKVLQIRIQFSILLKVRQMQKDFFKPTFLPKNKWTNSTLLLVDLFSFIVWKKVKTPKRHFEINWPLRKKSVCSLF